MIRKWPVDNVCDNLYKEQIDVRLPCVCPAIDIVLKLLGQRYEEVHDQ